MGGRVDTHYGLAGQSRWSLKKCLVQFKHLVKHIVATCLPKEFHHFFRACTNPNPRLCTFAITNFLSCIQCIYIPSVACKEEYLLALCSLRSKCNTYARRRALLQGNVILRPCKLRLRAIPSWRNVACLSKFHTIIPHFIANSEHFSVHNSIWLLMMRTSQWNSSSVVASVIPICMQLIDSCTITTNSPRCSANSVNHILFLRNGCVVAINHGTFVRHMRRMAIGVAVRVLRGKQPARLSSGAFLLSLPCQMT